MIPDFKSSWLRIPLIVTLLLIAHGASPLLGAAQESSAQEGAVEPHANLEPRLLTGEMAEKEDDEAAVEEPSEDREAPAGLAEDGGPGPQAPFAELPVVSTELRQRIRSLDGDEMIRVIVYLRHLPQDRIAAEVEARHAEELASIRSQVKQILAGTAAKRDTTLPRDTDNLPEMLQTTPQERAALDQLNRQHEELSLRMKNERTAETRQQLEPALSRVSAEMEALGGEVEYTSLVGSLVVGRIPAAKVEALGLSPDVLRVTEDGLIHGDLNVSTSSALMDAPGGLWANGEDGGIYDPAIIDSGLDTAHPGMTNSVTPLRDNFSTWYLVAAAGSANFGDAFTFDDLQGHGTHVAGITGSYGTGAWPDHLGFSFGVEKLVNLKAGWLNSSNGRSSMFWSDKYEIVERAINNTAALIPSDFNDDVDGFNLSYSGATAADDTDGGRFWDSVVSSIADTPVTISAGNTGPSNTQFNDPATSYNAITVANVDDGNTADRSDDIIRFSSSVGPTANGRRKPDIAAPGTNITAPNFDWESGPDYVPLTGTSMAAPSVLGAIMGLMDAGVFDELELKALLINTAQKNLPGLDVESDSDGWDPQIGWGVMHGLAAYMHRSDVFSGSVTPRDTAGEYQLYKGVMRDEGPGGEGRDRATLVWNRHATYNPADAPVTFFTLSDLNLRLYNEATGALIDSDLTGSDNVQQVRVGQNAPDTDVVVKAYAWSTAFNHGGGSEPYALALEENFTEVDLPTTFQGIASWPLSVEPLEEFQLSFWIHNNSEIASHQNVFNLELPVGFVLVSGTDTQGVGSILADENSTVVHYTIRASAATGAATVVVQHTHNSYLESYGPFNWNMGLTVEVDVTPPTPNPMSFSTPPNASGTSAIDMTASLATDQDHGPVEYYLDYTSSPTGGPGGSDSGWQASRSFSDTGLGVNESYCYRAWARDNANSPNQTTPSPIFCVYTFAAPPGAESFGPVDHQSVTVRWNSNGNPAGTEYRASNLTETTDSGWTTATEWVDTTFTAGDTHTYVVEARNGDGIETGVVLLGDVETPIFIDGFESGDSSVWSSSVP